MLKEAFLYNKGTAYIQSHWQLLLKLGIIFCVISISAAFGLKGSQRIAYLIGVTFAGVLAYLIFTRFPGSSILAILLVTFLVPLQIGTGTNVALNSTVFILAALFAIWFLDMLVVKKEIDILTPQSTFQRFSLF